MNTKCCERNPQTPPSTLLTNIRVAGKRSALLMPVTAAVTRGHRWVKEAQGCLNLYAVQTSPCLFTLNVIFPGSLGKLNIIYLDILARRPTCLSIERNLLNFIPQDLNFSYSTLTFQTINFRRVVDYTVLMLIMVDLGIFYDSE